MLSKFWVNIHMYSAFSSSFALEVFAHSSVCTYVTSLELFIRGYSGPEVIKLFSCSTQLSMKFSPLINVKMPTIVGILTCMSGKNNILGLTER